MSRPIGVAVPIIFNVAKKKKLPTYKEKVRASVIVIFLFIYKVLLIFSIICRRSVKVSFFRDFKSLTGNRQSGDCGEMRIFLGKRG